MVTLNAWDCTFVLLTVNTYFVLLCWGRGQDSPLCLTPELLLSLSLSPLPLLPFHPPFPFLSPSFLPSLIHAESLFS